MVSVSEHSCAPPHPPLQRCRRTSGAAERASLQSPPAEVTPGLEHACSSGECACDSPLPRSSAKAPRSSLHCWPGVQPRASPRRQPRRLIRLKGVLGARRRWRPATGSHTTTQVSEATDGLRSWRREPAQQRGAAARLSNVQAPWAPGSAPAWPHTQPAAGGSVRGPHTAARLQRRRSSSAAALALTLPFQRNTGSRRADGKQRRAAGAGNAVRVAHREAVYDMAALGVGGHRCAHNVDVVRAQVL